MKSKILFGSILLLFLSGCIWVEDDGYCCSNYTEHIIYVNLTDYYVENFIDDVFVGTVSPGSELDVYSKYYDGYHWFYSKSINYELEWGPDEFFLQDGETFTIYLEQNGTQRFQSGKRGVTGQNVK